MRGLWRSPGFAIVVVLVLAVAMAALTSVFALLKTVVLQPLPFPDSDRLVVIRHSAPGLGLQDAGLSNGLYFHYADRARTLAAVAVYREPAPLNLRVPAGGTERVEVAYANAALFKVLRTTPAVGRLFTEEDGRPGFMNMRWRIPVLLAHDVWVNRFGADPNIVGRTITLNENAREVVGVLPAGFAFPRANIQIWMLLEPSRLTASGNPTRSMNWSAVARMRPGVTAVSARAELARVLPELDGLDPDAGLSPLVTPLKSAVVGDVAPVIWTLFGGMVFLLLVAGANAGGLFLVRGEHRLREMAVRRALGAHGVQLAALFGVEALVLTSASAAIGLLLATAIVPAVIALTPFELPRGPEIGLDRVAVLFAAAVALLAGIFCTLLSVRGEQRSSLAGSLAGGHWSTGRRRRLLAGPDALVALQVALALTLMAGSALMVKTYRNLSARDLGFSSNGVLTLEIGLPSRKASQHTRIYREVVERIRTLPQVEHASAASFVPLTATEDLFPVEAGDTPVPFKFFVPGYFDAMGTPIVDGERLAAGEPTAAPHPVLVSAALARRLYRGERAVGRTIRRLNADGTVVTLGRAPVPPFTIAGVVGDVREITLREAPTEIVYIPVIDPPSELSIVPTTMRVVVRTRVSPQSLAPSVRAAIAAVDPDLSVGQIVTMDSIVRSARAREAFVGSLLFAAAVVSLFLGAVGIYGGVAQVVRRRTREIGIRMALGARTAEVVRLVTAGSMRAVLVGGALGLLLSIAAARMLGSLLFGVRADDPVVFLTVAGTLVATATAAALLAARHAARMAPIAALRAD
jgi:predicted permease